jgi:peptide/nickel transport system permease protein
VAVLPASRTAEPAGALAPAGSLRRAMRVVAHGALKLVLSLLAVSLLVFLLTVAIPGDPGRAVLGKEATASQVAAFHQLHGLDRSVPAQYVSWLGDFVRGDWGRSYASGTPVRELIAPRFSRTLVLVAAGWLLAALIAVPIGLASATRAGSKLDLAGSGLTLLVGALPEFVIGILLIFVFGVSLGWLPVESSAVGLVSDPLQAWRSYLLPAVAVALTIVPYILRLTRANGREVVSEPYVRAAVLRGLPRRTVTARHILPNAAPPVVNALGIQLVASIGGVVVTETVFGLPGIGELLVQSVGTRDVPVVQAIALVIGGAFVFVNLVSDGLVTVLTPKLRSQVTA